MAPKGLDGFAKAGIRILIGFSHQDRAHRKLLIARDGMAGDHGGDAGGAMRIAQGQKQGHHAKKMVFQTDVALKTGTWPKACAACGLGALEERIDGMTHGGRLGLGFRGRFEPKPGKALWSVAFKAHATKLGFDAAVLNMDHAGEGGGVKRPARKRRSAVCTQD